MRVGTAFRYNQLSGYIGKTQSQMLAAQNRVITGQKIEKPSDDPFGTRSLIGIGSVRKGIAGYTKNIEVAKSTLTMTDGAYGDMGDILQEAQALAVRGATSTLSPAERENLASQVDTLQQRLVSLGNSQGPDGRYLFAGQVTDQKPFSVDGDGVLTYSGNTVSPSIETGPNDSVRVGETGRVVSDAFDRLKALKENLSSGELSTISNSRLAELQASHDALVTGRADVGRRANAVDATRAIHERRDTELTARASDIGEVDYASAIVDYTAAQSAYQAALTVASKGFTTGLMDYIR